MLDVLDKLNTFFTTYLPFLEGSSYIFGILGIIGGAIVGSIGMIAGSKGKEALKRTEDLEVKIKKVEINNVQLAETIKKVEINNVQLTETIKKLEISNAQIAETINNYGLTYTETKEVASGIFDIKAKKKPDFNFSNEESQNPTNDEVWISDVE